MYLKITSFFSHLLLIKLLAAADIRVCPIGAPLNCLIDACDNAECPAQVGAKCKSRCGGCIAEFFDKYGNDVTSQCECPPGQHPSLCKRNPCDTAKCDKRGECRANFCGGCKAVFYDRRGRVIRNCPISNPGPNGGICPPPPALGTCVEKCGPGTCPKPQLCCSNGCGHVCTDPYYPDCPGGKPLACKPPACVRTNCPRQIQAQCRGSCFGCIPKFFDKFGNEVTKACDCKRGQTPVDCLEDPCRTAQCPNHPNAVCRTDTCGTCTARFYDNSGREVNCKYSESGCDSMRCIIYICRVASCATHTQAKCRGICNGCVARFFDKFKNDITDQCACPGRIPEALCSKNLCDRKRCPAHPNAECRINRCGTCTTAFFDKGGNKVDCDVSEPDEPQCPPQIGRPSSCASTCRRNSDCPRWQYCCSNGCGGRVCKAPLPRDCRSTVCAANQCEVTSCARHTQAKCHAVCNGCHALFFDKFNNDITAKCPCPGRIFEADCKDDLCERKVCRNNRNAECRINRCGGCNAEFFDKRGNQVECGKDHDDPRCPAIGPPGFTICLAECSTNTDCQHGKICCSYGCRRVCTNPQMDPRCPVVRNNQVGICIHQCSSNSECRRGQICCSNGCGTTCRYLALDDRCPAADPKILEKLPVMFCPRPSCYSNSDCKRDDICCSNGCNQRCISPPFVDPRCPKNDGGPGPCDNFCTSNKDCGGGEICCLYGCGTACRSPVSSDGYDERCSAATAPVSQITCPRSCSKNSDCRSDYMCCKTYCGPTCVPKPRTCDKGEPIAKCTNLCKGQSCPSNPTAKCRVHGCSGCKFEFYDENNLLVNCFTYIPLLS